MDKFAKLYNNFFKTYIKESTDFTHDSEDEEETEDESDRQFQKTIQWEKTIHKVCENVGIDVDVYDNRILCDYEDRSAQVPVFDTEIELDKLNALKKSGIGTDYKVEATNRDNTVGINISFIISDQLFNQ